MRFAKITERLEGLGSDKWAVHTEGKNREARGESLIFLSIGEPDAAVPKAIMDVADRQMRAGRTRYSNGRGEPDILRALSNMYSRRTGRHVGPSQFLFLPGTQTALYVAFMGIVDIGDEVLVPDPYYATYEGVIAAAGGLAVPVLADPDRGFHLKAGDLAEKITPRTRALLLNTPGNPTGTVFTAEEISEIGALCREHDLWIVSDEVYATLTYGNTVFVSPFDDPHSRSAPSWCHRCRNRMPCRASAAAGSRLPSNSANAYCRCRKPYFSARSPSSRTPPPSRCKTSFLKSMP